MTKNKITKSIISFAIALIFPLLALCSLIMPSSAKALEDNGVKFHTKLQDVTGNSFNISSTYAVNDNIDGWKRVKGNTDATTMVIDVVKNFSSYNSNTYCISAVKGGNPGQKGSDNKILMINSANSDNNPSSSSYLASATREGYKNEISLHANSYYTLQASFKTMTFSNEANSFASIYLSNLTNESGEKIELEYEMISAGEWSTVYFFIATGDTAQKANLELWLGTKEQDSFGVVFFDEIYLQKHSENIFYGNYYEDFYSADNFYYNVSKTNTDSNGYTYNYYRENETYHESTRNFVSLCELDEKVKLLTDFNLDFEKDNSSALNTLVDWKIADGKTSDAYAQVLNINSASTFKNVIGNDYAYPGSILSHNNTKALALWTTKGKTGTISLISDDIELRAHECLKITAYVKVSALESGTFELAVKENDTIFSNFSYLDGAYKTMSTSATVSENSDDDYINDYKEVSIIIQGHDLYNSSINVLLSLGNETTNAEGCVVVDNVRIERVAYSAYTDASNKLKLTTSSFDSSSATIPNSYFNAAYSETKEYKYPLTADSWTDSKDTEDAGLYNGVINLYSEYYNNFKASNTWASSFPNIAKNDSKNVFMFYNGRSSYQSIKSGDISLSKNGYYDIALNFMTVSTEKAELTIEVYTSDDVLIYTDSIDSSSNWTSYNAHIHAGDNALTAYAVISFGTSKNPCQGLAFIDYVRLDNSDETAFASATKKADLSGFMLNLDPTNSVNENLSASLAYKGTSSVSGAGKGGIITGKDNKSYGYVKNGEPVDSIDDGSLENNVLLIQTTATTTYTLTSNFTVTLDSETYYKLTFRILTSLPNKVENPEGDENKYGISIGLKDLTLAENLVANDGWTTITMYFYNSDTSTFDTNLVFSLTANSQDNVGYAYLTDIVWADANGTEDTFETEFTNASSDAEYGKTIFTATHEVEAEDGEGTEDDTESNDTTSSDDNSSQADLFTILTAASSIITALAIVVAVIGYYVRKIKIKKVKKVKSEDYDRRTAINNHIVESEANRIKKEQEDEILNAMETYKAEIKELEARQKQNIALSRKQNGKITKDIEKEFKSYTSKRNKIQEKLNILNEELENINSPEYMISLQKKVTNQMIKTKK